VRRGSNQFERRDPLSGEVASTAAAATVADALAAADAAGAAFLSNFVEEAKRSGLVASLIAVFRTLLGAGRTCGETQPAFAAISQMMTSAIGASHESNNKPRLPMTGTNPW